MGPGSNDNLLKIWDERLIKSSWSSGSRGDMDKPVFAFSHHKAAVKAIDWCPWKSNLLVSGGGTNDRFIRFWDTSHGTCIDEKYTGCQIGSVLWSKTCHELISAGGVPDHKITVWTYPKMTQLATLRGHFSRILHLCLSPDGQFAASLADETLRFWRVFEKQKIKQTRSTLFSRAIIR